jgi:predicted GNAT family acetyltransferase
MSKRAPVTVTDNVEESRYEVSDESGLVVGFAEYRLHGDLIMFRHTEVDGAVEGRGVGSELIRGALDDARGRGLTVRPLCPFFKAFIESHPEYQDLLSAG